jgi:hypothetical protein
LQAKLLLEILETMMTDPPLLNVSVGNVSESFDSRAINLHECLPAKGTVVMVPKFARSQILLPTENHTPQEILAPAEPPIKYKATMKASSHEQRNTDVVLPWGWHELQTIRTSYPSISSHMNGVYEGRGKKNYLNQPARRFGSGPEA